VDGFEFVDLVVVEEVDSAGGVVGLLLKLVQLVLHRAHCILFAL
jgi:hypothetical protein